MTAEQSIALAVAEVVAGWSILRYFPADEHARGAILRIVMAMLSADPRKAAEQLRWLDDAMLNRVGEWLGPKELRGIFCSRYPPRDGHEADAAHHEFSPVAGEARCMALEPPKQERRLLPPGAPPEPVSQDGECTEMVKQLGASLPAVRVRKSDRLSARKWMESVGLGHMTGLPPLPPEEEHAPAEQSPKKPAGPKVDRSAPPKRALEAGS